MFFDFMDYMKKALMVFLCLLAIVFGIALFVGGFFFDLDAVLVTSWFSFVIVLIFALAFIFAVCAFIGWFLCVSPFEGLPWWVSTLLTFVIAIAVVVGFVFLFIELNPGPFVNLGDVLDAVFSFLK